MLGRLLASKRRPYLPRFREREEICLDLSGTRVTMRLPPHTVSDISQTLPPRGPVNIYDLAAYDHAYDQNGVIERFPLTLLLRRAWAVCLSLLHTNGAQLYMPVTLIDATYNSWHQSCLNQKNFEQTIIGFLNHSLGPESPIKRKYSAPCSWTPLAVGDAQAIKLVATRAPISTLREQPVWTETMMFVPLCETHFLLFQFLPSHFLPNQFSQDLYNTMIDSLIDSVSVTLTAPSLEQARAFSAAGFQYSQSRTPENWQYGVEEPADSGAESLFLKFNQANEN